jgi:putative membrane-bound dehydrogenase-like protein
VFPLRISLAAVLFQVSTGNLLAAPPVGADPRLIVELVAQEPDLVTPTGVAVDERGRIWVIENHTHQRPANYKGPAGDRIRIFEDFGPDGKARKISTFAEGLKDTMGIALGKDGAVFVATRSTIYLLRGDEKRVLAHLDTKADYPHNGLSGFAIDALGDLHFGLGENFGADYKLIGSDKTTLTGGGEGGSIYRMHPDGTGLVRLATGFWNPFHMAFDRWGRLFAVDNDPDARGPCRLLHIVPGGDYGYRFKYGRKGIHPFQSWNGELPGTLPMVAGTAEAPSGIVAYESDGLPEEYRGLLLVTSWGDHVIEQFQLEPRGASFGAKKKVMVRGGEDFRPVAIALAPDGSVVVSDWVDKSYPVHGKGRLWRIRMKEQPKRDGLSLSDIHKKETANLKELLSHAQREVRLEAADQLARREERPGELLLPILKNNPDALARIHALWRLAGENPDVAETAIEKAIKKDPALEVRVEGCALLPRLVPAEKRKRFASAVAFLVQRDSQPPLCLHALLAISDTQEYVTHLPALPFLASNDPFLVHAAVTFWSQRPDALLQHSRRGPPNPGMLIALRKASFIKVLEDFLDVPDPAVRRAAIQWVAEENLTDFAKLLDKAATKPPVTREVFEAWLAAQELLANPGRLKDPSKELSGDVFVLKVVKDAKRSPELRTLALRMLQPDQPKLKLADLNDLLAADDAPLHAEAIRALAWRTEIEAQAILRKIAADPKEPEASRRDAILGLSHSAGSSADTRQVLLDLLKSVPFEIDALRSLRGVVKADDPAAAAWLRQLDERAFQKRDIADAVLDQALITFDLKKVPGPATPRPDTIEAWSKYLKPRKAQGDSAAGERVFFHPRGPRCFGCHRIDGRGETIGPDLSRIGAALSRDKLIESILEPSKEIAPAFVTWLVTTRDGKQHVGVIVNEGFDSTLTLADADGKRTILKITEIEDRVAQTTSIMPADLHAKMTRREFVDLLAFLESRK